MSTVCWPFLGETAARLVTAERATIYVVDAAKAEVWSHSAMGDGVGEIRFALARESAAWWR